MKKNVSEIVNVDVSGEKQSKSTEKINSLLDKYNTKGYKLVSTESLTAAANGKSNTFVLFFELMV